MQSWRHSLHSSARSDLLKVLIKNHPENVGWKVVVGSVVLGLYEVVLHRFNLVPKDTQYQITES